MTSVATPQELRFGRAEKALLEAESYTALQDAWARHRDGFTEDEARQLLDLYHDRAAQFAAEHFKYARIG